MKRYRIFSFGATVLVSLGFTPNVSAEPQSRPQTQQSAQTEGVPVSTDGAKPRKVWTEDDLTSLRKPWDAQQDREAVVKQQTSEDAAKSNAASPIGASGTPDSTLILSDGSPLPKTVEDAKAKVSTAQREIEQMKSSLEKLKEAYRNAIDDTQRSKLKFDVDLAESDLRERQDDLTLLQDRLAFLKDGKEQVPAQTEPASIIRQEDHH